MRPKQFLPIFDGESLFQKTCKRTSNGMFAPPLIISNVDHRFLIGEQLEEMGLENSGILLEPVGRNTAAPAALAAYIALEKDPDALILLAPSDHLISDEEEFNRALQAAIPVAQAGTIVTFGIKPNEPNTGYGYIKVNNGEGAVKTVERFVEKPDLMKAKEFLQEGCYLWNAGIFLYSAKAMRDAFTRHKPEIWQSVGEAYVKSKVDLDFQRLDLDAFTACPSISFDYAIMEKAQNIACVPMDPNWSDLGAWPAIWESQFKDENKNVSMGEAIYQDASNNLVYSEDAVVSIIGLDNIMVVNTPDALLVAAKDRAQDVKKVVEHLDGNNRQETIHHVRKYRPWGWSEEIAHGDRFKVHSLMIKSGQEMSLQRHMHRAEHWVVVNGTLEIIINDKITLITENQSVYVPLGASHKLSNPGKIPVRMIEIQSGSYIAEDDIFRH
ncbi:mannose-1-phosphate guanylyltransferase/mannose-6-phosphate isomerase [Polycladidibacter stylochi]|uniref:mannose-1-phosphate guanylyltransferase/mannose-6-phosphate isomerase n=1 Tax=Polycladidibacter stylochi TaxID=1807766 RepID=UPI001FCB9E2D|nr:mannose-1-phosphate guanylyltransferase/mannose-6-phosphate isomerase [Pseudovibrio stylochi]